MPAKPRYMLRVMNGTVESTPGGLQKKDIKTIRKNGAKHYVSKKRSAQAKKNFAGWNAAVKQAKKNLNIPVKSFVPIKGALYKEAARLYY